MGCHFLLQGIFPTQESNLCLLCLLHQKVDSVPLSHQGSHVHSCLCTHSSEARKRKVIVIVQLFLLPIHPCGQEEKVAANRLLHILWGPNCCSVAKSCPTLCDSIDCSPPGSSVHGILQSGIVEWVAISFSRGSNKRSYICFWDMCAKHIMMFWSLFER